ncbi:plasmid stabilization protein [Elstera cyanobacteriorum]|uniref:Plasmid stabilization protein n=1 Tax=Elstera cyanobacteriorum TaxID=2022747 RepID=A0A255XX33_9PROT|nr:type II toxin-antitoxin system RelE/ParE family toxin [Elstera cyanobacteriorum]OYQ20945.1 plasmid stabilization protein [Elstera cyanobacteriorum]GFZ97672.1 plasmid stabilization protein [Elstera cyanobacteriorum]
MAAVHIQEAAAFRLDEIYRYTRDRWGDAKAADYIDGLFDVFTRLENHAAFSKPIPAEFGIDGFFTRYQSHIIYWRRLSDGCIGIVTVLHVRMHQIDRFREAFDL